MGNDSTLLLTVLFYLAGMVALYWVIRLAVRHALKDSRRPEPPPRWLGKPTANPTEKPVAGRNKR